jgi:hypothetical protein
MNNHPNLESIPIGNRVKYLGVETRHPLVMPGSTGILIERLTYGDEEFGVVNFNNQQWTMNMKDLIEVKDIKSLYIKDQIARSFIEESSDISESDIDRMSSISIQFIIDELQRIRRITFDKETHMKIDSRINYLIGIIRK